MGNKIKIATAAATALAVAAIVLLGSAVPTDSAANKELTGKRPHDTSVPDIPTSIDFCGEEVPLNRVDVYESLDREIVSNTFLHSSTLLNIKRSGRYFPMIEGVLRDMGMPDDLKYLCVAESNLTPTINSPAGAVGLWQFMEGTAKEYGLTVTKEIDERYDPEKSTRAACKMMRTNKEKLGSWTMAAAAYNGGAGRVSRKMDAEHVTSYYDIQWAEETARYVYRILAYKTILTDPDKYGFTISEEDKYAPYDTHLETLTCPQEDLAQWAIDHGSTYKELRMLNPWIIKPYLRETKGVLQVKLLN